MACHAPLRAWYSKEYNKNGKRPLVFNPALAAEPDQELEIGCGRCAGCRLERSRQWAMRITHEASMCDENSFITLTFDDVHLDRRAPEDKHGNKLSNWSIWPREFQLFMKRLRKRNNPKKIKYYHCGEYGEKPEPGQTLGRPHYHACLFNHDFDDKIEFGSRGGNKYYISGELESLWPYGHCIIGEVTFDSAAYVARYIMKKRTGENTGDHYRRITGFDPYTGEVEGDPLTPEYVTMSRGIGKSWFNKYQKTDVYSKDYVTVNGKKCRPPKYYDRELEKVDPDKYEQIKLAREEEMEFVEELSIDRRYHLAASARHKLERKRREL